MFCTNCGSQLSEGALFCTKCGAKVDTGGGTPVEAMTASEQQGKIPEETPCQNAAAVNGQYMEPMSRAGSNEDDFKNFVISYVRDNTAFQSVEELLNSKVPLPFMKKCFGIPFIILFIIFSVGFGGDISGFFDIIRILFGAAFMGAFFALPFGYAMSYVACLAAKSRYSSEHFGKIDINFDMSDLILFLNTYLKRSFPCFCNWGYLQMSSYTMRSAIQESIAASGRDALKQVRICTEFVKEKGRLAVIKIGLDPTHPDSGQMTYAFDAENQINGVPFVSHDWGFAKYKCLVRITPILQAAMEYYLKIYKSAGRYR